VSNPTRSAPACTEIRDTFATLFQPGQVVEVRILHHPRANSTTAGYFDDHDKAAAAAARYSGKCPGVYVTLNEINPALLARINNRMEEYAKQTTSDNDVLHRWWLPLDFDPVRPAGIPSTNAEHRTALKRAEECSGWLAGEGWPSPIVGDSGNGAHLLYPIDLPNDPDAAKLSKRCLAALAWKFSDEAVELDTSVHNAARIWKLYGTTAAKGDGCQDRPHRTARILSVPEPRVIVPRDLLEALAAQGPPEEDRAHRNGHASGFDLENWIREHGVPVERQGPWNNGGHRYVLRECPFNEDHQNLSAYIVQFSSGAIAGGAITTAARARVGVSCGRSTNRDTGSGTGCPVRNPPSAAGTARPPIPHR
jgi:hypothetical protein